MARLQQDQTRMWQPSLLTLAVSLSLAAHAGMLIWQMSWHAGHPEAAKQKRLRLVYESRSVHDEGTSVDVRSRLKQLPSPSASRAPKISVPEAKGGGGIGVSALTRALANAESGGAFGSSSKAFGPGTSPGVVIDLTDVANAARGDPVSLTYFSAIREQIQRTADETPWEANPSAAKGIIYVVFKVDQQGGILSARSTADQPEVQSALGDIAVKIIQSAAPFPAFPPSFDKDSLAIMVPLDFSAGS